MAGGIVSAPGARRLPCRLAMGPNRMGSSRGIGIALLALVALAALLRLTGIDRLQPHRQEADWYVVLQKIGRAHV